MDQFENKGVMTPEKKRLFQSLFVVFVLLGAFLAVEVLYTVKSISYVGRGVPAANVINVTGKGEVIAVPDTGSFSFSVVANAKVVADAQGIASTKTNAIIAALKALGIAEADIKTTSYNSNPTYEYSSSVCPGSANIGAPIYCPPGKQTLTGYEVSQTISVKIRKTSDSGTILAKVGELGATNISGLDFVIDDIAAVQAQARDKAIADAKAKAQVLAKSLGVSLSHIVNFEEGGNQPPIYYAMDAKATSAGSTAPVPQVPVGQDTITSNVTITYEIQ